MVSVPVVGEVIAIFILKTFWPWFLKHIWPVILKHITELTTSALKHLAHYIAKIIADRMTSRSDSAEEKAKSAEAAAKAATNDGERAQNEAIAKIWREVAEQFRQENVILKRQVDELSTRELQSVREEVLRTVPVLEAVSAGTALEIDGKKISLPALPKPE